MLLAELAGPSGVGKSAIYKVVAASGEITRNPKPSLNEALRNIALKEEFAFLIERIARTARGARIEARRSFIYRSLYKYILARQSMGKPMVIDGGLVQRGFAVEQLNSEVTLEEFWQAMPIPDALFMVSTDRNTILYRNKERNGDHDRSWQVDMALAYFSRAYDVLKERGVYIVSIDAMRPAERNASIILDVLRELS
jgi:thymidylate kinase